MDAKPFHERSECTPPEQRVKDWLNAHDAIGGGAILHVGIGNSSVAQEFSRHIIHGIAFYPGEKVAADRLHLPNYCVFEVDKHSNKFKTLMENKRYDYIIDVNMNSYAPSYEAFLELISLYRRALMPGGVLLADKAGLLYAVDGCPAMTWRMLKCAALGFDIQVFGSVLVLQPHERERTLSHLVRERVVAGLMRSPTFRLLSNNHYAYLCRQLLLTDLLAQKMTAYHRRR